MSVRYPKEKFITIDVFDEICKKYNLIHAHIGNYKEDVPEKNLLEIKNRKELSYEFKDNLVYYSISFELEEWAFSSYKQKYISNSEFKHPSVFDTSSLTNFSSWEVETVIKNYVRKQTNTEKQIVLKKYDIKKYNKKGLFIAAPKTHFNLENIEKKSKFGFFNVSLTSYETKDPIVFEYCINGIIRIISKWGTEDDQSFLDPALTNQILN